MEEELSPAEQPVVETEAAAADGQHLDSDTISFEDLGLDEITLEAIKKKGFVTPSPIQVLAIPRLLNGEANVVARARTGTGKTAAFGLPLVQRLRNESDHVKAIILEPTRELAMQTCTEMASFTTGMYPRVAVVYGGASMGEQIRNLRRGVEIVVGTPGRVQDLMDRGVLKIDQIEYFILDEGDELLDMGFEEDIENIFSAANPDCRVLLFSATVPAPIRKIAQQFMGDYEIVEEEGHDEEPLLIEQRYWIVRESEKPEALVRLIDISPDFYGLVFVQKKSDADTVCKLLDEKGYQVAALHGDIPQGQREKILARFRAKKTRVLVATDVAARGIDITGLTHVVNYELPFDGPTYVHRIGRTGRAGAAGMAVTFVRPEEQRRKLTYLRNAIKRSAKGEMVEGTIPSVEEVIAAKKSVLFAEVKEKLGLAEEADADEKPAAAPVADGELPEGAGAEAGAPSPAAPQLRKGDPIFDQLAEELCTNQNPQEVVASLLAATYGSALSRKRYGKINSFGAPSERGGRRERGERGERGFGRERDRERGRFGGEDAAADSSPEQVRLYVQLGWEDGYNPRRVAEFFSNLVHVRDRDVDAIDMADFFCLVSLPAEAARKAIELSQQDNSLPHIHEDVKASGGRRGRDRDRPKPFGFDRDRYAVGRGDRERDRFRSRDRDWDRGGERGGFRSRAKGGSHTRPNVHTATQRSGRAALFKKSYADEY